MSVYLFFIAYVISLLFSCLPLFFTEFGIDHRNKSITPLILSLRQSSEFLFILISTFTLKRDNKKLTHS